MERHGAIGRRRIRQDWMRDRRERSGREEGEVTTEHRKDDERRERAGGKEEGGENSMELGTGKKTENAIR